MFASLELFSSLSISPLYFVVKLRSRFGTKASWWGSRPEHQTDDSVSVALLVAPGIPGEIGAISDMGLSCHELKLGIEELRARGFTLDG